MNKQFFFYLVCIALLSTTAHSLSKKEVLKLKYGHFYCKDDICVSGSDYKDIDTIVIPNKEGKDITYIYSTCGINDINIGLCNNYTECSNDSQCFSNKCYKGYCSINDTNPPEECQYVRTVHNNPAFGDSKGYKMVCGAPRGYKCNSNKDCSSYNCEEYNNSKICEYPDDSGCHSLCNLEGIIVSVFGTILILSIECCICLCLCFSLCKNCIRKKKGLSEKIITKSTKHLIISAIVVIVILLIFWGILSLLTAMGI